MVMDRQADMRIDRCTEERSDGARVRRDAMVVTGSFFVGRNETEALAEHLKT